MKGQEQEKKQNEGVEQKEVSTTFEKVTEIRFTARVIDDEFEDKDGNKIPYQAIEMDNPFEGEDLEPIRLSFEKNKGKNEQGYKVVDTSGKKKKAWYMYNVNKALKVNGDLVLTGVVTLQTFMDGKKVVDYVSVDMINLDDCKKTRIYINNVEAKTVFDKLANMRLSLSSDVQL